MMFFDINIRRKVIFFEIYVLTCPIRVDKYCKTFSPKEMMCTMSTIRGQWNKENDAAVFSPGDQR